MSAPDPHTNPARARALAKRIAGKLDVQASGLAFAVVAVVICVTVFGLAPTTLALGLLALLVVE